MKLTYRTDIILIIALVFAVLWFVNGIVDIVRNSPFTDFELTYRAGEALNDGRLPYDLSMIHAAPTLGMEYRFPPFFASLLAFFTPYEFEKVALGWLLLNQVFYFGTLALLYKILGIKFCSVEFYILAIIFLVFQPTLDSLDGGQLDCFFLLLLSLTWWALESRRDKFAGVVNALATIIKIYPGTIILFFLLRRRWKALKFYIITLIALIVLSIILAGWNANYKFFLMYYPQSKEEPHILKINHCMDSCLVYI